ncbi:ClpXP protease specificity-enhancing factor [Candidatus Woesearchaeota archaeon]|nr:ClpXP protease specificity-enhancing factor [Candidatus Woesearchaeota archaeon]
MTPMKPYLIRAVYDWIENNHCTPYLLVNAEQEGVYVPVQFIEAGRIVLNIGGRAVQGLNLGDTHISFSARFAGKPMNVEFPIRAVLALYAHENGRGMVFDADQENDDEPPPRAEPPVPPRPPVRRKPVLKIVK